MWCPSKSCDQHHFNNLLHPHPGDSHILGTKEYPNDLCLKMLTVSRTDTGAIGILFAHLGVFGSGELNIVLSLPPATAYQSAPFVIPSFS